MSTKFIFGVTADNALVAESTTYATARAMTSPTLGTVSDGGLRATGATVGQLGCGQTLVTTTYGCCEVFVGFVTSGLTSKVSSAFVRHSCDTDNSATDFTVQARLKDWSPAVDTGDAVAGASLSGQTLLGESNTSVMGDTNQMFQMTDIATADNLNLSGTTYMMIVSKRQVDGNTPTGLEWIEIRGGDNTARVIHLVVTDFDPFPFVINSGTIIGTTGVNRAVDISNQSVANGNLLLLYWGGDTSQTVSQSSGPTFTAIDQGAAGTIVEHDIFARILDNTEPTGGWGLQAVFTSEVNDVALVWVLISGHGIDSNSTLTAQIKKGTAATDTTGTSTAPNPPNLDTTQTRAWLWMASFSSDDDDNAASWWPANYTPLQQAESAQSTSSCMTGVAYRQLEASAENPGAFTMAAAEEWRAQTLAIPPRQSIIFDPMRNFSHMLMR